MRPSASARTASFRNTRSITKTSCVPDSTIPRSDPACPDPEWLLQCYRDETPARPGLPYTELAACGPLSVVKLLEPFRLQAVLDMEPKLPFNEAVVRLAGYD